MRIGIDARLWNESGVGRYIRNLVKYLQILDKKNEYVLFVKTNDVDKVRSEKLEVRSWKIVPSDIRWHTIEEQLKFPSILNKEKLDLVHFPYFSVPIFYNRPFVVTIHDLILHHFPTGEASTLPLPLYKLKLLGYKFVLGQVANKAAKIITVSKATKEEIIKHLNVKPDKVIVTYEGIDHKIRNQKPETRNEPQKFFLYVGNAYPHKNLERMIKAFATINKKQPTISLVLVGKEDYFYKRLKGKVRKMNLVNNVIFYGEASDEELRTLYTSTQALVLPSLMEGFGLPVVEAMANKCLVLCSDIAVLHEVCGGGAIYFNPYDVNDITAKMEAVCSNDLSHFNKNIEDGLKRVKIFSWQKMAEETLKIYQSL